MIYEQSSLYQRAHQISVQAIRCSQMLPTGERYGARSQVSRAAMSVVSNLAEGWTRKSWSERRHFLAIAHGSLAELDAQLKLCVDVGWLDRNQLSETFKEIDEVNRILYTIRARIRT